MAKKKAANVTVQLGKKIRTSDQLIRRFNKLCKKEKIVQQCKNRSYYKSKTQKRRDEKAGARYRFLRKQSKKNQS